MPYLLGIDTGVASLGAAVINVNVDNNGDVLILQDQEPQLFVRIFPSVTGSTIKKLSEGKDEAKDADNYIRRAKRLQRRQVARRRRRAAKLFHLLQQRGLLPTGPSKTPLERDAIIKHLDKKLLEKYLPTSGNGRRTMLPELVTLNIINRNVPYILRALALKRELQPFELGRALYHLVQRRGFKSNRKVKEKLFDDENKDEKKKDEEEKEHGKVKESIKELREQLGGLTLGQFFASCNPDRSGRLVRNRNTGKTKKRAELAKNSPPHYTARDLYEDEFNQIWTAQLSFNSQRPHPILNLPFRRDIHHAIFYQRPLKSQRGKIGYCELETKCRRASAATLEFQQYRYWQKIHDLTVNGRQLTLDEKRKIAERCEQGEGVSWSEIAENVFNIKLKRGQVIFNHQRTKEDKLPVNTTAKSIRKKYPQWDSLTEEKKKQIVAILLADSPEKRIAKRLHEQLDMDNDTAAKLANVSLSSDYASYSIAALTKLLRAMQNGKTHHEALEEFYPRRNDPKRIENLLPPVKEILPYINNPSVMRSLTQLRKVVNAIIRLHNGEKPLCIRVELARILKMGRKNRAAIHDRMIENREKRRKAKIKLQENDIWQLYYGEREPKDMDVKKWMLWEECRGIDPYSGDSISLTQIFGTNPTFDVEHIYPKSLTGDSSFSNLTLCRKDYNLRKGNRTPKAAFGINPTDKIEYEAILARVKSFSADKRERFEQENVPAKFQNRMLNDASYIAKATVKYLATLYGGTVEEGFNLDGTGKRRIEVVPGSATARLRRLWGLNGILGPNAIKSPEILAEESASSHPTKFREDHRHHAIDAFVIANCSPKIIKQWADEEERRDNQRRQNKEKYRMNLLPPYVEERTFEIVEQAVTKIIVSHATRTRVSGELHPQQPVSPYEAKRMKQAKKKGIQKVQEEILKAQKKLQIAEERQDIKKIDKAKDDIQKAEEKRDKKQDKIDIGVELQPNDRSAIRRCFAKGEENHHVEVYEIQGKKGEKEWDVEKPVTLFIAYKRKKSGEPVVNPEQRPNFLFALHKGDSVKIYKDDLARKSDRGGEIFRIEGIDAIGTVKIRHHTDARPWNDIPSKEYQDKYGVPVRPSLKKMKSCLVKVDVDVLGNVILNHEIR